MDEPKIDWMGAKGTAILNCKFPDGYDDDTRNLSRAYLDSERRLKGLIEAAEEYEAFRGQSEPNPAMVALGDRLRTALAAAKEGRSDVQH